MSPLGAAPLFPITSFIVCKFFCACVALSSAFNAKSPILVPAVVLLTKFCALSISEFALPKALKEIVAASPEN